MNQLREYLIEKEISQRAFAKMVGVTQGLIHQWVTGKTKISPYKAVEIEKATNGDLKAKDLLPELSKLFS